MAPTFRPPCTPPLYPFGAPHPPGAFVVTRPFGDLSFPQHGPHDGLDIGNGRDHDPILAAAAGTVTQASFVAEAGGAAIVRIDHGGGWTSGYAHMDRIDVQAGQNVLAGTQIGILGSTGWVSGAHLHFDITFQGVRQDPWPLLQGDDAIMFPKGTVGALYGRTVYAKAGARVRREPTTTSEVVATLTAGFPLVAAGVITGQFVTLPDGASGNQWFPVWVDDATNTLLGFAHDSTVTAPLASPVPVPDCSAAVAAATEPLDRRIKAGIKALTG